MKIVFFVLFFSWLIVSVVASGEGLYEVFGFFLSSAYFLWNIYAYVYQKRMHPLMNFKLDFSSDGDKSARGFLFLLCIIVFVLTLSIQLSKAATG